MDNIDSIKLFNPSDPTNASKFSTIPEGNSKLDRFARMRETAGTARQETTGFGERWEQRICQLNNNAKKLFSKLNPDIAISPNCYRRSGFWNAKTPQTADLIISDGDANNDEEVAEYRKQSFKDSIVGDYGFGSSESQFKNLIKIIELFNENKQVIKFGSIAKEGTLTKMYTSRAKVHIIKIITPVPHFTMALYYPLENRIEYWDPSGSWGAVEYDFLGRPYSATLERRKQTRSNFSECLGDNEEDFDDDDLTVCRSFKSLIPGVNFVAMNTIDLQQDDADAYCQTWVLLYVYMRFIYPIMTTQECMLFFKNLNKSELLELIENWSEYLIYFDADKVIDDDFLKIYNKYKLSLTMIETNNDLDFESGEGGGGGAAQDPRRELARGGGLIKNRSHKKKKNNIRKTKKLNKNK